MFFTSPRFALVRILALGSITALGCAGEGDDADAPEAETEQALWQPAISEESARPASCPNSPIDQMQCIGKYCDDIAIHCSDTVFHNKISSYWLDPVSEENGAAMCREGEMISGISCSGKYCDNLSVECARFEGLAPDFGDRVDAAGVLHPFSYRMPFVSEERGGIMAIEPSYYPYGVACKGKYCDEIALWVARMAEVP